MIDVTDLVGHVVSIAPAAVVQIYYADYRTPGSGSVVIYGSLMQATHERAEELVARISDQLRLINLHIAVTADFPPCPVWIAANHIVGLKDLPTGTLVMTGMKAPEVVVEDYQTVMTKLQAARGPAMVS